MGENEERMGERERRKKGERREGEGGRESNTVVGFGLHVLCIHSLCTEPAVSLLTLALL